MSRSPLFPSSPLCDAIAMEEIDTIRTLLDEGADIAAPGDMGHTPLTAACVPEAGMLRQFRREFKGKLDFLEGSASPPKRRDAPLDVAGFSAALSKIDLDALKNAVKNRPEEAKPEPSDVAQENLEIVALLLDRGADPNAMDGSGATPLCAATSAGRAGTVGLLLDRGAQIDGRQGDGKTPLMCAAGSGRAEIVSLLLDRGADWKAVTDGIDRRPGKPGYESIARSITPLMTPGITALHFVAESGMIEIARRFVALGIDVNTAGERGATPLAIALAKRQTDMAAYLRSAGARTGFLEAVLEEDYETAKRLPTPEPEDRPRQWGYIALNWAVRAKNREAVALLTERGIRPDPNHEDGERILKSAAFRGDDDILAMLVPKSVSLAGLQTEFGPLNSAIARGSVDIVKQLIARGIDVNGKGAGASPLTSAVMRKDRKLVRMLLEAGANPDGSEDIIGPLGMAAHNNDIETVRILLEAGADPEMRRGGVAMAEVHTQGKPEIQALLKEAADKRRASLPPPEPTISEKLFEAAKSGDIEVIRKLIAAGCDIHQTDRSEMTALQWTVLKGHAECARLLLENGADPRAANRIGISCIRSAAHRRDGAIIALLKEYGAEVGPVEAAVIGNAEALEAMLVDGAEIDTCGSDGLTPLMAAAAAGNVEIVQMLLDRGARHDGADNQFGNTALGYAASKNCIPAMDILLRSGADPNGAGESGSDKQVLERFREKFTERSVPINGMYSQEGPIPGYAPLDCAILSGRLEAANLLLDRGSNIERPHGLHRGTPLIHAAQRGDLPMVQLLLDRGADIHGMDIEGQTALYHARMMGKSAEVTALLLERSEARDRELAGG